ncbi:MAG: DUF4124 domain-containing protein [Burkholderiales bacterium]
MAHRSKRDSRQYGMLTVWFCLCFALCVAPFAHADSLIYKGIDKDGVVSYSQAMPTEPGAHDVTTITIDSLPADRQRAAARTLANLEKLSNVETAARGKRLASADRRIEAALQRLQQAERNLSEGSAPTGNDRVGNARGHARLRDSYFERVLQLQADVDQAQQDLNNAYAARNRP